MDKKKKQDHFFGIIRTFLILTWTAILGAFVYLQKAMPEKETILDIRYGKSIRDTWDMTYANSSLFLFALAAVLSVIGIIVNFGYLETRKHPMSFGMILAAITSITAVILYVINL